MEFKLTKSRETFHFNPSINFGLDSNWKIGLIILEVYNPIFIIKQENIKFELHTDTFNEFSVTEVIIEFEVIVNTSDSSHKHLQDETIGPRMISAYRNLEY